MRGRLEAADLLPLVAAAALPLIFLHVMYQPALGVGRATAYASDIAILLIVLAAATSGFVYGWQPLRPARVVWVCAAAMLAIFAVSCFWRPLQLVSTHLITAAKFGEYVLLAPAAVLLFRRAVDLDRFMVAWIVWAGAASLWGFLQFCGLVNEFDGLRPVQREVSFIGHESLGSFTGSAMFLGFVGLALGERRRLSWAAIGLGGLGVVIDASISVYAGVLVAGLVVVAVAWRARTLSWRRALALGATLLVVGAGVEGLRGGDVSNYLSLIGIHVSHAPAVGVQTGSQRLLLLYIGYRIWLAHPWLGVGFEHSGDRYQPFLAAAHRAYPNDQPLAFPSKAHPWGIQNFWLQVLADTGVVGLAATIATFAAAFLVAARAFARNRFLALVGVSWLLLAMGTWTAIGIVSGIPLDAVTFFGVGLAAAAASITRGREPAAAGSRAA